MKRQRVIAKLKDALAHVEAAADRTSDERGDGRSTTRNATGQVGCGVEVEHREAMHLYLKTWVIWPLKEALELVEASKR